MASLYLFSKLPIEIIKNILTFNKNFVIRKGEIITIKKIILVIMVLYLITLLNKLL